MQRQGKYFIIKVNINGVYNNGTMFKEITQNFVIYENDYNDFEVSFGVI